MQMRKKERSLLLIFLVGLLLAGGVYLYGGKPHTPLAQAQDPSGQISKQAQEAVADNAKLIKVHVKGAVNKPGVYQLPTDSRVIDAIDAAGGAKEGAGVQQLNLAAVLTDGAEVVVPDRNASGGEDNGANAAAEGKVNLNTASAEELDKLPGIGAARANAIVEYRNQHGAFAQVDDLRNVPGFGAKLVEEIRSQVTVQ